MMPRRTVSFVAACAIVVACRGATGPDPSSAVACTRDSDCSPGPCGPCEAGATITYAARMQECVVNPCPGKQAFCAPDHTCVIR